MKKIVVMASGEGSNFSAIVESGIKVNRVITNNPNANVIKRAKKAGVGSYLVVPEKDTMDSLHKTIESLRKEYDEQIDYGIHRDTDLIVLAGWMRILSTWFCKKWEGKMINIHPSLLPAFAGGCHAIENAYNHGCKIIGVTIHWVIPEVDAGPIITQRAIHKLDDDTLEIITERIHNVEHYLYPKTIKELINS
jgi:phosphoribosylglycinamide formyltransferase-1